MIVFLCPDVTLPGHTGDSNELGFAKGRIEVFRLDTGGRVGWTEPDRDIGWIGLQDTWKCLSAHQRSDAEYVIFLERDWKAKVLMFRCRPQ